MHAVTITHVMVLLLRLSFRPLYLTITLSEVIYVFLNTSGCECQFDENTSVVTGLVGIEIQARLPQEDQIVIVTNRSCAGYKRFLTHSDLPPCIRSLK